MSPRNHIARQLVAISHRLSERGFVAATDGNVSARLDARTILITGAGLRKGSLGTRDLVRVTLNGAVARQRRQPSTETAMHLAIYRERPDVKAVVHAHPPFATAYATARIPMTPDLFPEVVLGIGAVPLAPYATPSTPEVAASIMPFIHSADAILLANHGVVTVGASLEEACNRMEKVEHAAHITFLANELGGAVPLTAGELERLRRLVPATHPLKTTSRSSKTS